MKLRNAWTSAFLLTTLVFAQTALAVTPAEEVEKKCIKPKFRDFVPEPRSETAPESEIAFHMNRIGDPLHVKASAKKIPLELEIIDKGNFYLVTTKLPAELRNEYARIHIEARSTEGDCIGQDGWLIKISGGEVAEPGTEASQPAEGEQKAVDKPADKPAVEEAAAP